MLVRSPSGHLLSRDRAGVLEVDGRSHAVGQLRVSLSPEEL